MNNHRDGLARSVQVRLARHAKAIGVDPNFVLTRYSVERFLYRLSCSQYADRFVLKGALLMLAWFGDALRPTGDVDMLGLGDLDDPSLIRIFSDVCKVEVNDDAMIYFVETVRVEPIRVDDSYGGTRVTLASTLGAARLRVQVDVGVGDAVVPAPTWFDYPSLLGLPCPRLRVYSPETVIAEKLHAIVLLGLRNSRMKDYFDLNVLAREGFSHSRRLQDAIAATFERRQTMIPGVWPIGLSSEFAHDPMKEVQWSAFLKRNRLKAPALHEVIENIRGLVAEPLSLRN